MVELNNGLYIAFEAVDGVGKTTQMRLLKEWLERVQHYTVFSTREPGGTDCDIAEQIRSIILNSANKAMAPETEALLFAASRAQAVNEVIKPHLANKEIVLSDRSLYSSLAYQAYGRGLNFYDVKRINTFAVDTCKPDFVFYLHLPYDEIMKRKAERGQDIDRMEDVDKGFLLRTIQGFDIMAKSDSWVTIDASKDIDATQTTLRMLMRSILSLSKWKTSSRVKAFAKAPARTSKDYVHGTEGSYREENIYDD